MQANSMSSKGRQIAKSIGKSIKKKFEADFFQFPFGLEDQQRDVIFLPASPYSISPHGSPPLGTRRQIDPDMQSLQAPKKSSSLGTISATESSKPNIIDHEEIISLTHDVKKFSDSLARLKLLFTEGIDPEEDARVVIHEGLGEVLSVLNPVMQHNPPLQSPDIFTAARSLITMIKDYDYEEEMSSDDVRQFCDAIDQLALAFSSSVSEYLMGDMGPQLVMDLKTKSMNNIAIEETEGQVDDSEAVQMSAEELDGILVSLDTGLSVALQRAKVWSRYLADIITYIEKKTQLEVDYAKNLTRLANSVQHNLKKEGFLPLQSVYCTALSQDGEYASNLQATQALLHSHKFVEPLSSRRSEHDKVYKSVKEVWHREYRKMTDSVTNLRKAQALYMSRQQDHERARELAQKTEGEKQEKRRKAEEEAMHKAAEAETTYKACVAEANFRQQELFKVKGEQLARLREQIQLCDQVIKDVTVEYFQLYHAIISPLPLQLQTLSESSQHYQPGSQYAEYVRRLPGTNRPCLPEVFVFEPYIQGEKSSSEDTRKESVHSNGSVSDNIHSPEGSPVSSPRRDKYRIPVKAWGQQMPNIPTSDTDSASCSSKSHESSPGGSPHRGGRRKLVSSQSLDELTEEELIAAAAAAARNGKEKRSQIMKRTRTMDESLDLPGLLSHHAGRRNTTFGVDFQEQVNTFHTKVPPIVSKCLSEIEKRGVMIKGIYRVSGVKSKVEHLCQRFDIDPEAVDLQDIHPNVISNVLKLYLRQLPEPLLTFRLYSDFIHTAKENMSGQLVGEHLIDQLRILVSRLPSSNLRTCAVLMHHLQRVASHSELNQMSASNLGIVFGPTLLRPLEGSASLASLVDTPHQTRAIELLITYAHIIFGPSEDFQIMPSQTPIEQLSQALSGVLLPGTGSLGDQSSSSKKSRVPSGSVPSGSSLEADDLSSSVFESSPSPSGVQPSACEFILPGTASQDRNETQLVTLNGLDIEGPQWQSDEDEEDTPDIPLPDQSTKRSEPLSATLTQPCIKVPGGGQDARSGTSPAAQQLAPARPAVTKSASSPMVSPTPRPHIPPSLSAPGMGSGPDLSARHSAAAIMETSSSDRSPSQAVDQHRTQTTSEESGTVTEDTAASKSLPQPSQGETTEGSEEISPQADSDKSRAEDMTKKKLHSQQLQNIKYLTKAPSVDESESQFFPKTSFTPATAGSVAQSQSSSSAGPVQDVSHQKDTSPSPTKSTIKSTDAALDEKKESMTVPLPVPIPKSPILSKGASSRRSILEEMPIPTLSKPVSPAAGDGGASGSDAVTIPASPTIRRREIPSKIPTSPALERSAHSRASGDKTDNRADKFRQEQRKLVKAIKSDAKVSASGTETTATPGTDVTSKIETSSKESGTHQLGEPSRRSGIFEDVVSGGCALSSRPSSQSEEASIGEVNAKDGDADDSKPVQGESYSAPKPEVKGQASTTVGQQAASSQRPLASSSSAGKTEVSKAGHPGSPSQKQASYGEGTSPKQAVGRGRPINMPSTCFVKKTTAASVSQSSKPLGATSSTRSVAATTTSTQRSSPVSNTGLPRSGLPSRSAPPKTSSPALTAASPVKRSSSTSSTDQSPLLCSRASASLNRSLDESSTSSKSSSSVSRKSSGRGGELSSLAKSSQDNTAKSESVSKSDVSSHDKTISSTPQPSPLSSQRQRRPSGEANSSPTGRAVRSGQRKPPPSSGTPTGSPRKIHERCQQDKPASTAGRAGGQQGSGTPKTSRPSQLPTSTSSAAPQTSSPATTPTSSSGRLSQDRSPRFV